jgi:hypothetical protein
LKRLGFHVEPKARPWRTDPQLAGETLQQILGGLSVEQKSACVAILRNVSLNAQQRHPGRWSLNLHEDYVRVVVGLVMCLQFRRDGLASVLVARTQAPPRYRDGGEYEHAPGCVEVGVPISKLVNDWPRLEAAHRAAMTICAELHAGSGGHRRAHSPGLLESLRRSAAWNVEDEEDAAEEQLEFRTDIDSTVREALRRSRRGQGTYRTNLLKVEARCRVTGVDDERVLRASHIKPWAKCSDNERLDGYNGLLLAPHVDLLFDRGWISFSDDGGLLVAADLPSAVLAAWRIATPFNAGAFKSKQKTYLAYHRAYVFEKKYKGILHSE